jgi:hypothetical protein
MTAKVTFHYHYFYEKLRKMKLEEFIEAPEYTVLAERYPHIAKSLRLEKEREKLRTELRFKKDRSERSRIRKRIIGIEMELKRERALKYVFGESMQENLFRIRFILITVKQRISSLVRQRISSLVPPSFVDLKSLDALERGWIIREWTRKRKKKRR